MNRTLKNHKRNSSRRPRAILQWKPYLESLERRQLLAADFGTDGLVANHSDAADALQEVYVVTSAKPSAVHPTKDISLVLEGEDPRLGNTAEAVDAVLVSLDVAGDHMDPGSLLGSLAASVGDSTQGTSSSTTVATMCCAPTSAMTSLSATPHIRAPPTAGCCIRRSFTGNARPS